MPRSPKLWVYGAVGALAILLALPSLVPSPVLDRLPPALEPPQLALGLDLKGGAHLVLEIDDAALRAAVLDTLADDARAAIIDADVPARVHLTADAIVVRPRDPAAAERLDRALADAVAPVQRPGRALPEPAMTRTRDAAGVIRLEPTEAAVAARREAAMRQSLEILRRRVDEVGIAEPSLQRVGADRLLVQIPGVVDPTAIRQVVGTTARLGFHRVALDTGGAVPAGYERLAGVDGGAWVVERAPVLGGEHLVDAAASFEARTGEPAVAFRFDGVGARRFARLTEELVGQPFAIVLDGEVLSAPVVREPIPGGRGEITGDFTVVEASRLAALLRAGALPVSLDLVEQRIVGPDLGQDAIRAGLASGLAGFALVGAVMTALYGGWGVIATGALLVNVAITLATLALLGGTLTLPGIAGLVLSLGLAVDANVLINARIREELAAGKSPGMAVKTGCANAWRAILDGNLTTLLATGFLFFFGLGPIRGFALTMAIGISASLFTAVSLVQALMEKRVRAAPRRFRVAPLVPALARAGTPDFRFMRRRGLGLAVSAGLSLAALGLLASPGLNLGIDFAGGVMIEAQGSAPAELAALRGSLEAAQLQGAKLQTLGDGTGVLVRLGHQPGGEAAQNAAVDAAKAALHRVDPSLAFTRVEAVGPKISGELARMGVVATLGATLAMFAYIWARFDWPFALGAVATIVLDVVKLLGFFALTGLAFDLTAVAALLTLIGYSVNDKVVVYDRIRENLRRWKATPLTAVIDRSLNETLARSLATSATTLTAVLPMALFGGATLASFAWAMVVGVVVATLSSIFIATPFVLALDRRRGRGTAVTATPALG